MHGAQHGCLDHNQHSRPRTDKRGSRTDITVLQTASEFFPPTQEKHLSSGALLVVSDAALKFSIEMRS